MNTALKHWKEAATLIVAAGHRFGGETLSSRTPLSAAGSLLGSSFRRAQLPDESCYDYKVLMLKRSSKSGYLPNAYVFPGGMVDSSDFSSEWLDIFKSFLATPNFGLRSVRQTPETRPIIYATDRRKLGSAIPGEVAFRICALRETFEESGALLFVPKTEEGSLLQRINDRCSTDEIIHHRLDELCSSEVTKWRTLVIQNPSNFIRMCRELEVLPNIWALHEWSNWLTPIRGFSRRFDTAFFMCCLQEPPHAVQDEKEIVHCQWSTPSEVLQSYQARKLWTSVPQFYELGRLCHFPLLNDLNNFACLRAAEGCEQWLPVILPKGDHVIGMLPGDELYPVKISREAGDDTDPQQEEPGDGYALNRFLVTDSYVRSIQITVTPKYNQLLPVVGTYDFKSEL
ncbi:acyl-coenzyme A diphosphatase NUDT19 [Aulostomus maculatus]